MLLGTVNVYVSFNQVHLCEFFNRVHNLKNHYCTVVCYMQLDSQQPGVLALDLFVSGCRRSFFPPIFTGT